MKIIKKTDLNKVSPKFQQMVKEAWSLGEDVPYGVIYLSDKPLTDTEINRIKGLKLEG